MEAVRAVKVLKFIMNFDFVAGRSECVNCVRLARRSMFSMLASPADSRRLTDLRARSLEIVGLQIVAFQLVVERLARGLERVFERGDTAFCVFQRIFEQGALEFGDTVDQ